MKWISNFAIVLGVIGTLSARSLACDRKTEKPSAILYGTPQELEKAKRWKNRVYLATYPRSGNHWIRYLIEEATHIATSSSYLDNDPREPQIEHLKKAFPWGGYCCDHGYDHTCVYPKEGQTVVVKTHFPTMKDSLFPPFLFSSLFDGLPYQKTIRIIRHPVDSFYSLYRFSHLGLPTQEKVPNKYLPFYIESWRQFQEYWDNAENVLTIRFEDLYNDPSFYLKLILETIGYQATQEDIERAVAKYPPKGGILKNLPHFSKRSLSLIEVELSDLMEKYGYEATKINER